MTPRHRASWPGWVSARGGRFRLEEGRQVPRAPAMFRMFRLRGGVARGETGLASTGRRRAPRPRSPVRNFLRLVVTATGDGQFRFDVVKEAERRHWRQRLTARTRAVKIFSSSTGRGSRPARQRAAKRHAAPHGWARSPDKSVAHPFLFGVSMVANPMCVTEVCPSLRRSPSGVDRAVGAASTAERAEREWR